MERRSVSEQPHELQYEAQKTGASKDKVESAKKAVGNQRSAVEKKLKS